MAVYIIHIVGTSQSRWRGRPFACQNLNLSSIDLADYLLCGDAVGNAERQVEPSMLAIACGQLVGARAQLLQPGDSLVVKLLVVAIVPLQKPFS
jgi:hypothetical protein